LPSQRIDRPTDLKYLQIPYPVVLKSQVPTGGRGRAGGIRFVENTIDAIAAARAIFNLPILGKYPKVLLAESRYDTDREFYLAIILDYALGRPVLLGSPRGGINVAGAIETMQRVVVEQEFSPFYARRLALKMGLRGHTIGAIVRIIQKMHELFVRKDLDLIEINPLGISIRGEVMALDGKISVNDNALGRHSELMRLVSTIEEGDLDSNQVACQFTRFNGATTEGNIGIICNGTCLATATLDLIYKTEGKPARCSIVGEDGSGEMSSVAFPRQQLQAALEQLTQASGIKVVLVNILGSAAACEAAIEVITHYLMTHAEETPVLSTADRIERPTGTTSRTRRHSSSPTQTEQRSFSPSRSLPHFVIRTLGGDMALVKEHLVAIPVHWMDNLDEAVAKAISLAD
jgi:succinyl-CoA synthetase beta subunit